MLFAVILAGLQSGEQLKQSLRGFSKRHDRGYEIIVADKGNLGNSTRSKEEYNLNVLDTGILESQQKIAAIAAAAAHWLLILPPAAKLEEGWQDAVTRFTQDAGNKDRVALFRYAIGSEEPEARIIESRVAKFNARGFSGGRQGILIHKETLEQVGGYKAHSMLEDAELLVRLRKKTRRSFILLNKTLIVPADEYKKKGYKSLAFRRFLALYFLVAGFPPSLIQWGIKGV